MGLYDLFATNNPQFFGQNTHLDKSRESAFLKTAFWPVGNLESRNSPRFRADNGFMDGREVHPFLLCIKNATGFGSILQQAFGWNHQWNPVGFCGHLLQSYFGTAWWNQPTGPVPSVFAADVCLAVLRTSQSSLPYRERWRIPWERKWWNSPNQRNRDVEKLCCFLIKKRGGFLDVKVKDWP